MRKLLVATSAVFLCGAANIALAGNLLDSSGNHDLKSSAASVVGWQYDPTLPSHTLSATSAHIAVTNNGVITIGSHALSSHGTTHSVTGTDADLTLANATTSPGLGTNLSAAHTFSAVSVPAESSRLLPLQ
jgi:hypothetical protein